MTNEVKNISLLNGLWVNDRKYNVELLSAMIALEVLLAYSPFGYIVLPTISITTLFMGVMAAALWGGPLSGAAVGLVFGLTSMWKASVTAINPSDLIFSPVRSGAPWKSILLALGPRILFGIIAGLVYYAVMKYVPPKTKVRLPVLLVVSLLLERVHSALTYLFMDKVFQVEGASISKAWTNLLASNRIKNYIAVILVILFSYLLYDLFLSKKYYAQFSQTRALKTKFGSKYTILMLVAVLVIILTASHLWERIQIVLFDIDHFPPEQTNVGLLSQVIFQFILAALSSLHVAVLLFKHARNVEELERSNAIVQLNMEKKRAEEMEQSSLRDPLTGVYNRKGLKKFIAEHTLDKKLTSFFLIDIDHFKGINDNFGHDAGDSILTETANMLTAFFDEGSVFRIGGDEFAVLVEEDQTWTPERMWEKWDALTENSAHMHTQLSALLAKDVAVTLSVGVCFTETGYDDMLYPLADSALYETKKHGRAGCTLVDKSGTVRASWKDPNAKSSGLLAELNSIGVCRYDFPLEGSGNPKMFCSEDCRTFLCVPAETPPVKCYEAWRAGVSDEDFAALGAAKKTVLETGMASYTYTWNHPVHGPVVIESYGSGKVVSGFLSIICHYQLSAEN